MVQKSLRFATLLAFLLFLVFPRCEASPSSPGSLNNSSQTAPSSITKTESEALLLREQNKIIRDYQESMLETVYFSLGGVFAMAVLLAGFGWWSNLKFYESDKERMRQDFATKIGEIETKFTVKIQSHDQDFERELTSRNDLYLQRVLDESSGVRLRIDELRVHVNDEFKKIKSNVDSILNDFGGLKKSISGVGVTVRGVEELIWDLKGVDLNVLLTQCQRIEFAIEADADYQINDALNSMVGTIEKILAKESEISDYSYNRIVETLNALSNEYAVLVVKVMELLGKIPRRK